jgi:hypothetical protein
MIMSLFLNAQELHELTGYKKPGRQIGWLRAQGFTFRVAADGHPRVDRSHYLKLMGGTVEAQHTKTEPNFRGLLKLVGVA